MNFFLRFTVNILVLPLLLIRQPSPPNYFSIVTSWSKTVFIYHFKRTLMLLSLHFYRRKEIFAMVKNLTVKHDTLSTCHSLTHNI